LLELLETHAPELRAGNPDALRPVIRSAIEAKIRIVRDDERERGRRALLNLGHTVGHALEAHGHYRRFLHGEAVAVGTIAELRAAASLGLTPAPLVERTRVLLERLGLPVAAPAADLAAAWPFVGLDKKREGGCLRLPVVSSEGLAEVRALPLHQLKEAILS
jgi:3-dehydroquinate synthetase